MKILIVILQICILYLFNFVGNFISSFFNLAIPGSIIGLILLFICLALKIIPVKLVESGAGFLLSVLTLFFIPATVGIMNHPSLLSIQGAMLALAVMLSTILAIIITGTAGQFFEKRTQKRKDDKACSKSSSRSV